MQSEIGSALGQSGPEFSKEHTPRALKFLTIVDPKRVPPLFHFILPKESNADVPRFETEFWEDAYRLINSFGTAIDLAACTLFESMKQMIREIENADEAKLYLSGKEVEYFALSFLRPHEFNIPAPPKVRKVVCMVVREMDAFLDKHPEAAQQALTHLIFAVARYEVRDLLGIRRDNLLFPAYADSAGVTDGLMVAGAQQNPSWRRRFYTRWVLPRLQPCTFEVFDERMRRIRHDPLLLLMLVNRMEPKYPWSKFEREFLEAIYEGIDPVPADVGRQALVFACGDVLAVWRLQNWPTLRVVQERLLALARRGWYIRADEFAKVVYGSDKLRYV